MWTNSWDQLNEKDKEQFARVVNLLYKQTFILRDEFDSRLKNIVINKDFRFLERHYNLLQDYLQVSGWEIQLDNYYGVAALYNRYGHNHYHLNKNTTYFLYILRLIYQEQQEKLSIRKDGLTTIGEMIEKMFHLGLIEKKPAETVLRESLSTLKNYKIIDKLEGSWTSPETSILIYPSILLLITNEKISALYQRLQEEKEDEDSAENAFD